MQASPLSKKFRILRDEVEKAILGQRHVLDSLFKGIICNGHILIEGPTGTAKTIIATFLSRAVRNAELQRIQFTPDLLPSDITGVVVYEQGRGLRTIKGPVFTNILLADEINRTPPKVQSALLQAMQERQVTIGRSTYDLPRPFFVIATQNPIETKGVYTLPEAQLDRFIFKLEIGYPGKRTEFEVIDRNIDIMEMREYRIRKVISAEDLLSAQGMVRKIMLSEELKKYVVAIVNATRRPDSAGVQLGKYIQDGASPRASIFMSLAAKATAFLDGREYVTPEDIRSVANPVLRHRIILSYEGKATGMNTDAIIEEIISKVPVE